MNRRLDRHPGAATADEAVHERDTVPAPGDASQALPRLVAGVHEAADDGIDEIEAEANERETLRPTRFHSDTTALAAATEFAAGETGEEYPTSLPPPPPLPGEGSARPLAAQSDDEWEARPTPLVNPLVTREEALAGARDELRDAHQRITTPGELAAPSSAAPRTDDDPTVPRTPLEELIPPPPAGPRALELASLAPVANTKPPPVPVIAATSPMRRAALAFAAIAVALLAGTWLLSGAPASDAQLDGPRVTGAAATAVGPATADPPSAGETRADGRAAGPIEPSEPVAARSDGVGDRVVGDGVDDAIGGAPEPPTADATIAAAAPSAKLVANQARARRRVKRAPVDPATLPEVPTRATVVAGLEALRSEVAACAEGRSGVAEVDLSIASTGRVAHAVVGGDFAGSIQGSCIARAVRRARFEPFRQARFRILYPFSL